MKIKWIAILSIIGLIAGSAYYWNYKTLRNVGVIARPTAEISTEPQNASTENPPTSSPETQSTPAVPQGWINILLLGSDKSEDEVSRTDSIMLVSANVDTHQVSVISVPRDTRVNLPGVGLTKINHANALGEAKGGAHEGTLQSASAVSNLLGLDINFYVKINLEGFRKVVDSVGGIDINLPNAVNDEKAKIHLPAGDNHLSGDEAYRLSRARYGLPNGDFDRQQGHFYMLSALADKMLTLSNISKLPEELTIIQQELVDTNLTTSEMLYMGLAFKGLKKDTIEYFQLPGRAITAHDPLVGANLYYYEPDMAGIRKVVQEALK